MENKSIYKMTMEPRTEATFGKLEMGDRFHFMDDKRKTVWTKINEKEAQSDEITKSTLYPKKVNKIKLVVFLRKTNELQ